MTLGFGKTLTALRDAEPGNRSCTDHVGIGERRQFEDQCGNQNGDAHENAHHGAVSVSHQRCTVELSGNGTLSLDEPCHGQNTHTTNYGSPQG